MRKRRLAILGLGSVLFGGCYYTETLIGVLLPPQDAVFLDGQPILVPDSVAAGSRFAVDVYTVGGGCISFNSTRVDVDGNVATITPYDTYRTPGRYFGCDAYETAMKHESTLRFTKRGQATVSFRVRETQYHREPLVLSRTVHVY